MITVSTILSWWSVTLSACLKTIIGPIWDLLNQNLQWGDVFDFLLGKSGNHLALINGITTVKQTIEWNTVSKYSFQEKSKTWLIQVQNEHVSLPDHLKEIFLDFIIWCLKIMGQLF